MNREQGDKISKDWTPKERLQVVESIALEMIKNLKPAQLQICLWSERLRFLAIGDAEFLEANRNQVLYG